MSIYTQDTPPEAPPQASGRSRLILVGIVIGVIAFLRVLANADADRMVETALEDLTITHKAAWVSQNTSDFSDCAQFEGTLLVNCLGAFERGTGADQTVLLILRMFTFMPGDTPDALAEQVDVMLDAMNFTAIDQNALTIDDYEALRVRIRHELSMSRGQMVIVKPTLYAYIIITIASGENENYLALEREMDDFISGIHFTETEAEATEAAS